MNIIQLIYKIVDSWALNKRFYLERGKVESVDEAKATAKFINSKGTEVSIDLSLTENVNESLVIIPKVGASIIVGYINDSEAYLIRCKEADKIHIKGDVIFNGGENDGMVKINNVVEKLNNLENTLNTFMNTTFNAHTHLVGSLGSPTAPPVPLNTSSVTPTIKTDLENIKIKQ